MSKLVLTALMGVSLLISGQVMAQEESSVNQDLQALCDHELNVNIKEYVCEGLLGKVSQYDSQFKPPAAFLEPSVSDDRGGQVGGGGGVPSSGGGDYIEDGFSSEPQSTDDYEGIGSGGMQ